MYSVRGVQPQQHSARAKSSLAVGPIRQIIRAARIVCLIGFAGTIGLNGVVLNHRRQKGGQFGKQKPWGETSPGPCREVFHLWPNTVRATFLRCITLYSTRTFM